MDVLKEGSKGLGALNKGVKRKQKAEKNLEKTAMVEKHALYSEMPKLRKKKYRNELIDAVVGMEIDGEMGGVEIVNEVS